MTHPQAYGSLVGDYHFHNNNDSCQQISAIGSLVQPLFNKGQNRANLRIAKARQEQALVAFNQALLVAGAELSDALTACQLSSERLALRQHKPLQSPRR